MQEQWIYLSDGCKLFVKLHGGSPEAPLIIAQHGAPGASDHTESETSYAFLQDRFRVLVFDARGSGKSDVAGPFTRQRWVADIEELRQWVGAETFILGGGSHGGIVALEYALAHGNRLQGLIVRGSFANGPLMLKNVLDMALSSGKVDAERQRRLWTGKTLDNADYGHALSEVGFLFSADPNSEFKVAGPSSEEAPQLHHETFNEAFGKDLPAFDVTKRLHDINVSTLVAVGALDRVCPLEASQVISKSIANASLVSFGKSGHSPPEDQPDEWKACLSDFVDSLVQ
ncbi:MAG: hypothetical protein M1828_007180 [Chrysothrix sp. TS-e1954]|nr:MAG: hypothetical protein M1828_007180 [Chrysothrix sp. TS-e1954]